MNGYDFDSGLDELNIESTGSIAGGLVLGAMIVAFMLASLFTTFSFFFVYAPGLGRAIHPEYSPYISGFLGMLFFGLAGLGWTFLRSRNSDTGRQFVIATFAAVVTISLDLLTSALYVLLSSSFDVGIHDAAGQLTQFGQVLQIAGVIIMTAGFVVNFGSITAYVNSSAGTNKAVQTAELRALVNSGRFAAQRAWARTVTFRTLAEIDEMLPNLSERQALANSRGFMSKLVTAGDVPPPQRERDNGRVAVFPAGNEVDLAAMMQARLDEEQRQQNSHSRGNGVSDSRPT